MHQAKTANQVHQKVSYLEVDEGSAGQRLDNFLIRHLKGVPKSKIYQIIRSGEVRVNKGRVKVSTRINLGDTVRVPPIRVSDKQTQSLGFKAQSSLLNSIVYEDDGLMVLNKPAGMAVHAGSGLASGLIETLRLALPHYKYLELAHRLDRQTSGCLIVAKKASVLKVLHEALRGDGVDKRYLACVAGSWPKGLQKVNAPLLKSEQNQSGVAQVRVDKRGKPSLTQFQLLEKFKAASLIEAKPVTGRTHQIRVHAQFSGYPLLADDRYGDFGVNREVKVLGCKRLFLHAYKISFYSPAVDKRITVEAPLADDLEQVLAKLRQ